MWEERQGGRGIICVCDSSVTLFRALTMRPGGHASQQLDVFLPKMGVIVTGLDACRIESALLNVYELCNHVVCPTLSLSLSLSLSL